MTFNGLAAPILYAQEYQINAVVPFAIAPNGNVAVEVTYNGRPSQSLFLVGTVEADPELFKFPPETRDGPAAILNQDGSINSVSNPAADQSIITLYVTGTGLMDPPLQDGAVVTDITSRPVLPISVSVIQQAPAEILYAGPAPGMIAGALQINLRLPALTPCGGPGAPCPDVWVTPVMIRAGSTSNGVYPSVAVRK